MVYLKIQPYRDTSLIAHKCLKLHSKFYGQFRVLTRVVPSAYKLLLPEGCQLHDTFHVSQLKQHLGPQAVPNKELPLWMQKALSKSHEALLQRCMIPRNNESAVQWLIQWVNLQETEATWEDVNFIHKIFPSFHP
jgi:hypothetical protein